MPKPTIDSIPEERVAAILARAAELDRHRKETLTVDAIRAAALDAGISADAVDTALEEYAAGQVMAGGRASRRRSERGRRFARVRHLLRRAGAALRTPLKLAGLFFVVGLAGAAGEGAVILGWILWLVMAGRLVLKHRRARRATPFVVSLVLMTLGFMLGLAATDAVEEDPIVALVPVGLMLLAAGSAVIKLRLPRRAGQAAGLEASAG